MSVRVIPKSEVNAARLAAKKHFLSLIEPFGLTVSEEAKSHWWPSANS